MVKEAEVLVQEKEVFPPKISPMVPTKTKNVPLNRKEWILEPKWDGVRSIAYVDKETGRVKIESKTGRKITEYFPEFFKGLKTLSKKHSLIFDGCIVFMDGKEGTGGIARSRSQTRPQEINPKLDPFRCHYFVFDLIYLDGESLLDRPLFQRKRILSRLLSHKFQNEHGIVKAFYSRKNPRRILENAREMGFEGVVFKRRDSHYIQRSSKEWLAIDFND